MKDIGLTLDQKLSTELVTLRDYIRLAVSYFNQANLVYGHGTDNSWDEAVNLVLTGVHLAPDTDPHVLDARLTESERQTVINLIQLRITKRIPVPYLVNEAWFAGLNFYVDQRVIIPRSPIGELIDAGFSPWVEETKVKRILDLGTGSGCIAITAALAFPNAQVDAIDIKAEALAVAKINIERYEAQSQVHLIQSDVFEQLAPQQYDIIISNPPYVATEEYASLPTEYQHEPKSALEAGIDGLAIVERILIDASNYLAPKGILVIEVGPIQELLEAKYPNVPFTWLQFEKGGEGVFLLTADELQEFNFQLKP